MGADSETMVHPTAILEPGARIGPGVRIWHFCHVRSTACIEEGVSLGRDVYIDSGVTIGRSSHVQNGVSIYRGVHVEPWCFIGPHVVFTNDLAPRAGLRTWKVVETFVRTGSTIGAGAVIRCGVTIDAFALVAAGAVLTHDVPPFHLALGWPAKPISMLCGCARTKVPLRTPYAECIRPCCEERLEPEMLRVARSTAEALSARPGIE